MLTLTRGTGETIRIRDNIEITVLESHWQLDQNLDKCTAGDPSASGGGVPGIMEEPERA